MHYFIGRDIDGDGYPEYICNMDTMALTEDPRRALQFTTRELGYIDMAYLNQLGFYAIEADRYNIPFAENMLWRALTGGFRPRVAPPPRRTRRPGPAPMPPRGPMGGYSPMPPAGAPGMGARPVGGMGHGPMGGPAGGMGRGPAGGPVGGMGRGPAGGPGRGGRGPAGGPGRGPGGSGPFGR